MNEFIKLTKQVDDIEYKVDNLARQNVDILRKTINAFAQNVIETFSCAIRRGKLDIEVFTSGQVGSIVASLDGVVICSTAGGFLVAHAEGVSLGMHTVSIAINASGGGNGAMIVCYGAV